MLRDAVQLIPNAKYGSRTANLKAGCQGFKPCNGQETWWKCISSVFQTLPFAGQKVLKLVMTSRNMAGITDHWYTAEVQPKWFKIQNKHNQIIPDSVFVSSTTTTMFCRLSTFFCWWSSSSWSFLCSSTCCLTWAKSEPSCRWPWILSSILVNQSARSSSCCCCKDISVICSLEINRREYTTVFP